MDKHQQIDQFKKTMERTIKNFSKEFPQFTYAEAIGVLETIKQELILKNRNQKNES